ncbi:hypothetical protein AWJ20_2681 [Sugiyamaella lignohabitans]|uniref:Uncharacterized protein n=1 Tax=Sugiyamaella lignohabitans TaxID=796027 RepID=A0A167FB85_9ASCO|nr:uncharacterized protein AWJ20_2681 [Sugiyamaella lignohabitans]ANB15061.1 hypothetical protein AWJ20_2681 [Sugiyamaella lignohabitans]
MSMLSSMSSDAVAGTAVGGDWGSLGPAFGLLVAVLSSTGGFGLGSGFGSGRKKTRDNGFFLGPEIFPVGGSLGRVFRCLGGSWSPSGSWSDVDASKRPMKNPRRSPICPLAWSRYMAGYSGTCCSFSVLTGWSFWLENEALRRPCNKWNGTEEVSSPNSLSRPSSLNPKKSSPSSIEKSPLRNWSLLSENCRSLSSVMPGRSRSAVNWVSFRLRSCSFVP